MNATQINSLSNAIAQLITATFSAALTQAQTVAAAPVSPATTATAKKVTIAKTNVVTGPKVSAKAVSVAAGSPDPKSGLIDISKLSGLVKARAVAANNRVIKAKMAA